MKRPSSWIPFLLASLLFVAVVALALRVCLSDVQPSALERLIDRADTVVVLKDPWAWSPVLFESSEREDLDALKAALRVQRPFGFSHCMCDGTPAIFLY